MPPRRGNPATWGTAGRRPPRPPRRWFDIPGAAGPGIRGSQRPAPPTVGRPQPPGAPAIDPVQAQYQAELALLNQIQQLYQQQQAQQVAQQRAAYAALAQQLQPIAGQVEDIVNRQTGAQTGFAKGFSDATAQLANQSTGAAQDELASFGMPSGNLSPVGSEQGNALYGEFGFIPATGFSNYGAAQAAAAAMLPGTARLQGEQQIGRMMSQFQTENLLPLQIERLKLAASLPQRRAEAQAEQAKLKEARRAETIDLYKAGLLTQRQFARRMGVKNWRKFPNVIPGTGSDKELTFREVGGSLFAIDPLTGRAKLVIQGPSPSPDVRTVGGYLMERDPTTGKWVRVAGTGPAPKEPANLQHVEINGKTYIFDPGSGAFYTPSGQPANPNRGAGGGKAPSASDWKIVNQGKKGYWALQSNDGEPVSSSELRQILKDAGYTLGQLNKLTEEQMDEIGIGYYQLAPEEVYLQLIRVGISPRRARQMVRSQWKDWGYRQPPALAPGSPEARGERFDRSPKAEPAAGRQYTGPTDMSPASRQQRKLHAQQIGQQLAAQYGWNAGPEWDALIRLWTNESGWDWLIPNYEGSGAYGIPQALPASKMRSAGADWKTNPATQIKWGLNYIKQRYGSPSRALNFWTRQSPHWY